MSLILSIVCGLLGWFLAQQYTSSTSSTSSTSPEFFTDEFVSFYRYGDMRFIPRSQLRELKDLERTAGEAYEENLTVFRNDVGRLIGAIDEALAARFVICLNETDRFVWPSRHVGHVVNVDLSPNEEEGTVRTVHVHTLSATPRVLVIPGFLSDAESDALATVARGPDMIKSKVGGGDTKDGLEGEERDVRTSKQTWIWPGGKGDSEGLARIRRRVLDLVQLPGDVAEAIQLVHYDKTQHYYGHHDYAHKWESTENPYVQAGGNRFVTVLFYLNDVEQGGHTVFPFANTTRRPEVDENGEEKIWVDRNGRQVYYGYEGCDGLGLRVPPQKGAALIFYNLKEEHTWDAVPESYSFHAGCDVEKGEKMIANVWLRNRRINGKLFNGDT